MSSDIVKKRIDYGYAGMSREQAYRAYMGLTCDNPHVSQTERDDRIEVLKQIMEEELAHGSSEKGFI